MMIYDLRAAMIFLFFVLSLSVVQAQESEDFDEFDEPEIVEEFDVPEIDCETEMVTTYDMRVCTLYAYGQAKKTLNEVYQKRVEREEQDIRDMQAKGKEDEVLAYWQKQLEFLRQSQSDWIKFRDNWCYYEENPSWGNGTMAPILHYGCLTRLTEQQTERLRQSLGK